MTNQNLFQRKHKIIFVHKKFLDCLQWSTLFQVSTFISSVNRLICSTCTRPSSGRHAEEGRLVAYDVFRKIQDYAMKS